MDLDIVVSTETTNTWISGDNNYSRQDFIVDNAISQNSVIMDKYKAAAEVSTKVLEKLCVQVRENQKISDLCKYGDELIIEEFKNVFPECDRGIAFPTCINVNRTVCGYSPREIDSYILKTNDVAKVELAVHIDGYISKVSHTLFISPNGVQYDPIEGPIANVICASYLASELVEFKTIMKLVKQVADSFKVHLVEKCNILTNVKRYLLYGEEGNILQSTEIINDSRVIQADATYIISILMTNAEDGGKVKDINEKPTVYQRNFYSKYNLKTRAGRNAFVGIVDQFGVFPFTTRDLDSRSRMGLKECSDNGLVKILPIFQTCKGSVSAGFSLTAMVLDSRTQRISNSNIPVPYVHSKYSLPPHLAEMLQ
jgi:curved DNA binding protein